MGISFQINCNCYTKNFDAFDIFQYCILKGVRSLDFISPHFRQLRHVAFDRLKSQTLFPGSISKTIHVKVIINTFVINVL